MLRNKNGCYSMVIYCLRCSDGTHSNMNEKDGKGKGYLIKEYMVGKIMHYDFECKCGYINTKNPIRYVKAYAIQQ